MKIPDPTFPLALLLVGVGLGYHFGWWAGVVSAGLLMALDHYVGKLRKRG